MKYDRNLVKFKGDDVYYNDTKLSINRQMIQDYSLNTGQNSESFILFYYKKELTKLRDKQLEKLLNEKNTNR
jgi:hypothetical protein